MTHNACFVWHSATTGLCVKSCFCFVVVVLFLLFSLFVFMRKYVIVKHLLEHVQKNGMIMIYLTESTIIYSFNLIGKEHKIFSKNCLTLLWPRNTLNATEVVWMGKAQWPLPLCIVWHLSYLSLLDRVFLELVCPLILVLRQIFFNLTTLFSYPLFCSTSWCCCSIPCFSQMLHV